MKRAIFSAALAACLAAAGCGRSEAPKESEKLAPASESVQVAQASAAAGSPGFEFIPPIADADPSVRHTERFLLPTKMLVEGSGRMLSVSFPKLETVELSVGQKMVTGIMREDRVIVDGVPQDQGMQLGDGMEFDGAAQDVRWRDPGDATAAKEIVYEQKVTVFETDMPSQHMWSPGGGKKYKVLWEKTFRKTVAGDAHSEGA